MSEGSSTVYKAARVAWLTPAFLPGLLLPRYAHLLSGQLLRIANRLYPFADSVFRLPPEIIVGYSVGSLALIADSFHMLNDVCSLIVALYALKVNLHRHGYFSQTS